MSKDERECCPNCDSPEIGAAALFGSRGNGRCSNCHGEGIVYGIGDAISSIGTFGSTNNYHTCEICSGTGQCQKCGGNGYYYYSSTSSTKAEPKYSNSSNDYSDYSYSSHSTSKSDSGNSFFQIVSFVVIGAIILGLLNSLGIINTNSNTTLPNENRIPTQPNTDPTLNNNSKVEDCQTNGTGECIFTNNSSRKIFLFVSSFTWSEKFIVEPNQTVQSSKMPPGQYNYNYSYFDVGNFKNNDVEGNIRIEKCSSESLQLSLPKFDWYKVTSDNWVEATIPSDDLYAVVFPYKNIKFRYYEDGEDHVGVSFFFLPQGTRHIYLKNYNEGEIEVSIQKVTPN